VARYTGARASSTCARRETRNLRKTGGRLRGIIYDKLTAEERFRLVLEAKARDDTTEVERLKRTCPTKTYSMSDAAYGDRYEFSELLVLIVALDLTQYPAKLEVAGAFAWAAPHLLEYAAALQPRRTWME
jgi:hypothetical protein